MKRTGDEEAVGEEIILVKICPKQISRELAWDRNRVSAKRPVTNSCCYDRSGKSSLTERSPFPLCVQRRLGKPLVETLGLNLFVRPWWGSTPKSSGWSRVVKWLTILDQTSCCLRRRNDALTLADLCLARAAFLGLELLVNNKTVRNWRKRPWPTSRISISLPRRTRRKNKPTFRENFSRVAGSLGEIRNRQLTPT
jgi:hypothetical protein